MGMSSSHPRRSDVFRAAIGPAVESLVRADPHLRGKDDAASIHAARVATRKLRSELRIFRPMLDPTWVAAVGPGLKHLAALLGAVRDTDVIAERMAGLAKRLPPERTGDLAQIDSALGAVRATAGDVLQTAACTRWYHDLMATLVAAVHDGRQLSVPDVRLRRRTIAAAIMRPVWKKLERAVRRAGDGADPALLHRVRIRAKACRYAAEAIAPFVVPDRRKRFERFMRHIARLQERLGIVHDTVLARQTLRAIAGLDRSVVDEIDVLEAAAASASQAAWRTSWKKLEARRSRFW